MKIFEYLYKLLQGYAFNTSCPDKTESHMAVRLTSKGILCFYQCTKPRAEAINSCWEAVKKDSLRVALSNAADPYITNIIIPSEKGTLRCATEFNGLNRTVSDGCGLAQHRGVIWIWGKQSDVMREIEKRFVNQSDKNHSI